MWTKSNYCMQFQLRASWLSVNWQNVKRKNELSDMTNWTVEELENFNMSQQKPEDMNFEDEIKYKTFEFIYTENVKGNNATHTNKSSFSFRLT